MMALLVVHAPHAIVREPVPRVLVVCARPPIHVTVMRAPPCTQPPVRISTVRTQSKSRHDAHALQTRGAFFQLSHLSDKMLAECGCEKAHFQQGCLGVE